MGLPYCRPDRLNAITWTLSSGTPESGYDVDRLIDEDPSYPLRIAETSIDLRGDAGSALRIDGLVLVHHNFAEGTTLRLQIHSDTATWGGATDIDFTVVVGAWQSRFAPNVFFDVASEEPNVTVRTRRYRRVTNTDVNASAIRIGEIVEPGQIDTLTRGVRSGLRTPKTYGRSVASGKKGPLFVHDRRTRDRAWVGSIALDSDDYAAFEAWNDQSYGVRPSLAWPLNSRLLYEPIYGRLSPTFSPSRQTPNLAETSFEFEELSCGEAY